MSDIRSGLSHRGRKKCRKVSTTRSSTENTLSPPEWQAPLPVRILQPYVVLENRSGGDTRPRKVWRYLYPFWCNTGVWRTDRRDDSNSRAMQSESRVWKLSVGMLVHDSDLTGALHVLGFPSAPSSSSLIAAKSSVVRHSATDAGQYPGCPGIWPLLHCALSLAGQCIVIGHVCNGRAGVVCGSVTTITRNCVHRSSPNWVCRWR